MKGKLLKLGYLLLMSALVISGCTLASTGQSPQPSDPKSNMPNPASVYCEQNGGKLELRQDASGGVSGVCIFADESECDEWAYFRSECKPGE